jgi:hypothetical protein
MAGFEVLTKIGGLLDCSKDNLNRVSKRKWIFA